MIILIGGATHTGKTALSQKLMERHSIPYLSIDHLKMGLILSGQTNLTASDDAPLTPYLWSIIKEIIKTAIENKQSLIIEGCYIPFDWQKDFGADYLSEIKFFCLVMSQSYIENNFNDIIGFENVIERRLEKCCVSKARLIDENLYNLDECKKRNLNFILIDENYNFEVTL
ncbi:MAG: ATP-binding protein [Clostridia bacterium]|nr:ATP-binding protein [Clostridia bacterium]